MRLFLIQVIAFFSLQLLIATAALSLYDVDTGAYIAAAQDKQAHLAAIESPKIILLGGSSTAFGFDSAAISKAFDMPVANMGIQASLGLDYMLQEAEPSVGKGDIVILSLEYPLYASRSEAALTIYQLLEQNPAEIENFTIDAHLAKSLLDNAHLYVRHVLRSVVHEYVPWRQRDGGLRRDWHIEFGDVVKHRELPQRPFVVSHPAYYAVDGEVIERLREFAELCRSRGANLFIFHPAVAKDEAKPEANPYQAAFEEVEKSTDIAQLNQPKEMLYERKMFFDSAYHVNAAGLAKRTDLLIERLKQSLAH
jgi:hypothetical protein